MVGRDLWGQSGLVPRTLRGGDPDRYIYIFNSNLKLLVEQLGMYSCWWKH